MAALAVAGAGSLPAEAGAIRRRAGDPERPGDPVDREPAPAMRVGARVRPRPGVLGEQMHQRLGAEPRARPTRGARRRRSQAARAGERQVERGGDVHDGAVAVVPHAEHELDDLLRGQAAPAEGAGDRGRERRRNPRRVEILLELLQGRHRSELRHSPQCRDQCHEAGSPDEPASLPSAAHAGKPLSDWHWR